MRMTFLSKYREVGLLLLRLSLGVFFLLLTAPIVFGGARQWARFGQPLHHFGLHGNLQWWGLAGALAQMIGALLLIAGWFFRPGVILVLIWMVVHALVVWKAGGLVALTSLEMCLIVATLFLIGPGKYSGDKA